MKRMEVEQMGRIVANFTHEVRNVLAVVRTSAGLMQDIQQMGKKGLKFADKSARALEKIDKHSKRGVDLSSHANNFAHACDKAESTFSPHDLADDAAWLMHRLASQKEVEIRSEATGPSPDVTRDRIRSFLAVSFAVDAILSVAPAGSTLTVSGGERGGTSVLKAILAGSSLPDPDAMAGAMPEGYGEVLAELAITLGTIPEADGGPGLLLSF